MIKDLTVEEITQILNISDESPLPCNKGQWVQWLVSQANNPKLKIAGKVNETGRLIAYIVILDNVIPPLFDNIVTLHIWTTDHRDTHELAQVFTDWGRKIGAKRGLVSVPSDHTDKYMEIFGGKKIASVYEWRFD